MNCLKYSVLCLSLGLTGAGAALADTPSAAPQLSPHEALLSDAIRAYLVRALGSEEMLVGRLLYPKLTLDELKQQLKQQPVLLPGQTLQITVHGGDIKEGRIAFGKGTQFQVLSRSDGEENCNGGTPFKKTVQVYSSATTGASFSQAKAESSSTTHSVSVSLSVGDGAAQEFAVNQFQAGYSFTDQYGSGTSSESGGAGSNTGSVLTQTDITVDPGQFVSVQNEVVSLVGNNSQYTGTATVKGGATIDFHLSTQGFNQLFPGMDMSHPVAGWGISLNADNAQTPRAYAMGNRVIFSPDGAFVFGRETNTADRAHLGTYSVFNLYNGKRMWSPVTNTCGMQHELYIDTWGHFYILCGDTKVWDSKTDNTSQSPCHYLTFIETSGELACLRQNPSAITSAAELAYVVKYPAWRNGTTFQSQTTTANLASGTTTIRASLSSLVGVDPNSDIPFRFTGRFSGQLKVSGPTTCVLTYSSVPDPRTGTCVTKGLLSMNNVDARGRHGPPLAPAGSVFSRAYCPSTQRFLDLNHQANGLMVAQ